MKAMTTMRRKEIQAELSAWISEALLPLKPTSVAVTSEVDALGQESWRALLALPPPISGTWEQHDVYTTRRMVTDRLEEVVHRLDAELPGATLVTVTADIDHADRRFESDVAVDDPMEPGEDPSVDLRAMVEAEDASEDDVLTDAAHE